MGTNLGRDEYVVHAAAAVVAWLPLTVQFVSVVVPLQAMPPPRTEAELALTVQFFSVVVA